MLKNLISIGAAAAIACISAFSALAGGDSTLIVTQTAIPTNSPLYSASSQLKVSTMHLAGGQPTSSTFIAANSGTNATTTNGFLWTSPIDVSAFNNIAVVISGNAISNKASLNYLTFFPTYDLVNYDSNSLFTIAVGPQPGSSNIYATTNITTALEGGLVKGFQVTWGVSLTNSVTNATVQVVVKVPRSAVDIQ